MRKLVSNRVKRLPLGVGLKFQFVSAKVDSDRLKPDNLDVKTSVGFVSRHGDLYVGHVTFGERDRLTGVPIVREYRLEVALMSLGGNKVWYLKRELLKCRGADSKELHESLKSLSVNPGFKSAESVESELNEKVKELNNIERKKRDSMFEKDSAKTTTTQETSDSFNFTVFPNIGKEEKRENKENTRLASILGM